VRVGGEPAADLAAGMGASVTIEVLSVQGSEEASRSNTAGRSRIARRCGSSLQDDSNHTRQRSTHLTASGIPPWGALGPDVVSQPRSRKVDLITHSLGAPTGQKGEHVEEAFGPSRATSSCGTEGGEVGTAPRGATGQPRNVVGRTVTGAVAGEGRTGCGSLSPWVGKAWCPSAASRCVTSGLMRTGSA
jgi:hypothetical protein